tara:strand:- start:542 stop:1081 length:540 start_codon:yes stop_codon:yes gene_type:complete
MGDITKEKRWCIEYEASDDPVNREADTIDIVITIPMKPRGKQRPRSGRGGRMYTPKGTRDFENEIQEHAARQMPSDKLKGLLRIDVVAFIQRPKRLMRRTDPDGPIYCGVTPDEDNILKGVQDALQLFMEGSDAVVAHGQCSKFYTSRQGKPRMIVRIRSLIAGSNERKLIQQTILGGV